MIDFREALLTAIWSQLDNEIVSEEDEAGYWWSATPTSSGHVAVSVHSSDDNVVDTFFVEIC